MTFPWSQICLDIFSPLGLCSLGFSEIFGGSSPPPPEPPPEPVVEDTFNAADTTNLNGRTTTTGNKTWTVHAGSMTIVGNRLTCNTNNIVHVATLDSGLSDCTIVCKIKNDQDSGSDSGLRVRRTSPFDWVNIELEHSSNQVRIRTNEDGNQSVVATGNVTLQAGVEYTLKAVLDGPNITAYVDDVEICSWNGATWTQSATQHGVQGYFFSGAYTPSWDDFQIFA